VTGFQVLETNVIYCLKKPCKTHWTEAI